MRSINRDNITYFTMFQMNTNEYACWYINELNNSRFEKKKKERLLFYSIHCSKYPRAYITRVYCAYVHNFVDLSRHKSRYKQKIKIVRKKFTYEVYQ
jgi:hypothetical protein